MTTITNVKVSLTGGDIKRIKAMIKGNRHNKQFDGLNYLLFETSENSITVTYNNANDYTQLKLETFDTLENAAFLFPIEAIKKMSSTKTAFHEFRVSNNFLTVEHIESGISQAYNVLDVDLFYKDPYKDNKFNDVITLDYNTLQTIFRANISTSFSDTRPVLQNVVLRHNKIISTDSHRLYMNNNDNFNLEEDLKIPNHIVSLLQSLTEKGDSITIAADEYESLKLHNNHVTIYARGTNGNYPEVDRLIPSDFQCVIGINDYNKFKKTLEAIKKGKDINNLTQVEFDYNNSTMKVYNDKLNVNAQIDIAVLERNDKDFYKIAFSAAYLLDAMKQLDGDQITLSFSGVMRPFIVKSKNDYNSLALTLPVRLQK